MSIGTIVKALNDLEGANEVAQAKGSKTRSKNPPEAKNPSDGKIDTICKQVIALGNLLGEVVHKLDEKFSAALLELTKDSESRNAALDCTINAKAASEIQKVCDLAARQECHIKLANVALDPST